MKPLAIPCEVTKLWQGANNLEISLGVYAENGAVSTEPYGGLAFDFDCVYSFARHSSNLVVSDRDGNCP